MSEEGETRILGTLEEDPDTEDVPAATSASQAPTIAPPAHDSRRRFIRRSPVPDPSSSPLPPPAPTPTPPQLQTPLSGTLLSATPLAQLSTLVRNLFTDQTMSTQTGEASTARRPNSPNTNPFDTKGKRPANSNQHSNASKCGYAPSYQLSSVPKLSGSENYRTWQDLSEFVLRLFNCWDLVIGTELLPVEERDDDEALSNFHDGDGYRDRYEYASAYFLETIEPQWLILLATHKTPPAIWQAFEDKFARENTSSFFDQHNSVFDTKYDTLHLLSDHISQYDTLWN